MKQLCFIYSLFHSLFMQMCRYEAALSGRLKMLTLTLRRQNIGAIQCDVSLKQCKKAQHCVVFTHTHTACTASSTFRIKRHRGGNIMAWSSPVKEAHDEGWGKDTAALTLFTKSCTLLHVCSEMFMCLRF